MPSQTAATASENPDGRSSSLFVAAKTGVERDHQDQSHPTLSPATASPACSTSTPWRDRLASVLSGPASVSTYKGASLLPSTTSSVSLPADITLPQRVSVPSLSGRYPNLSRSPRSTDGAGPSLSPAHASLPAYAPITAHLDDEPARRPLPVPLKRASYSSSIVQASVRRMSDDRDLASSEAVASPLDAPTTATSSVSVSTGQSGEPGAVPQHSVLQPSPRQSVLSTGAPVGASSGSIRRSSRGRPSHARNPASGRHSNTSPGSDRSTQFSDGGRSRDSKKPPLGVLGICALDAKARSKPSRNILNRLNADAAFEVVVFGDKVILDEAPANWPVCDYLISFFSDGFPLDKAIEYVRLRKPYTVNDLPMQKVLWDRRVCLKILDHFEIRTPQRIVVNRDGGPRLSSRDMAAHVFDRTGVRLPHVNDESNAGEPPPSNVFMIDHDTLNVDGKILKKPFVEKPVDGEDHNIRIYYSSDVGGGGRRLFRKINNKSSEADDTLDVPRCITEPGSSYIYEAFLSTSNHEDVKAYTVGPNFCHAETRKSPVVDGIVKRNTHGKEVRYVTSLSSEEVRMASRISEAFGQRVCGFDMLRVGSQSFVIDVNGWSFVKDNSDYYDKCAQLLRGFFVEEKTRREGKQQAQDGDISQHAESPSRAPSGHFSKVKHMLKSPSLPKISSHHHQSSRSRGRASPDVQAATPSVISNAPTVERNTDSAMVGSLMPSHEILPNPALTSTELDVSAVNERLSREAPEAIPPPASKSQWKLKGMVAVIRHADRTPKQKWKFTFHTRPFIDLLKGHREEVLLLGEVALSHVMAATEQAMKEGVEDAEKLKLLRTSLIKKGGWPGTKVQIKPVFSRKKRDGKHEKPGDVDQSEKQQPDPKSYPHADQPAAHAEPERVARQGSMSGVTMSREAAAQDNLDIEKLQLIIKWGGEPTHSARYQSQELGENMRNDLLLMNREAARSVSVYSSSERRSTTSAQLWLSAFLDRNDVSPDEVNIRKDLLDDSNAAKDEMDKVKKKLKELLRKGNQAPPQFAWPENMPEPYIVARQVVELMKFHRLVMRDNFQSMYGSAASSLANVAKGADQSASQRSSVAPGSLGRAQNAASIQSRWCSGEDPELFKERWEKLFDEFCDAEKVDPSKISELHDTMKFDALHNRQFLEWVFTPSPRLTEEFLFEETASVQQADDAQPQKIPARSNTTSSRQSNGEARADRTAERGSIAQFIGLKKRPAVDTETLSQNVFDAATSSYFKLFSGSLPSKTKSDARLEKLRELFFYSKVLFDFIGPQEYGISNSEKLEIGLLTSLPLLRAIVNNLEDMQASEEPRTSVYFTKESHIYTLLNCIIEGGIQTKIARNKIPELDYLSTVCFELYESPNDLCPSDNGSGPHEGTDDFNYSIRITISPGCHTFEPLDVQLDSRHSIGFAQRRSLTVHKDWKEVIETLRAKFNTVKLPKSFVAVNLAEKAPEVFLGPESVESSMPTIHPADAAAEKRETDHESQQAMGSNEMSG